jgi:hypothetical protein
MLKNALIFVILVCLLLGCAPAAAPKTAPTVDIGAIQTATVLTVVASAPTKPPAPTDIPPTAPPPTTEPSKNIFSWNYLAEQESGGIKVQVARVLIAEKSAYAADKFKGKVFEDKDVVVEIIFIVTNSTDKKAAVYPDQGTVIVGSEQVDLRSYMFSGKVGEDIGGDIFPGVTRIGGLWFGLKRTALPDLQKLVITFNGPVGESFTKLGDDYTFTLDLSQRKTDPLPDELK